MKVVSKSCVFMGTDDIRSNFTVNTQIGTESSFTKSASKVNTLSTHSGKVMTYPNSRQNRLTSSMGNELSPKMPSS